MNWIDFKKNPPTEEGSYLVSAPSGDPNVPWSFTAWWSDQDKRWTILHADFVDRVSHYVKITPPNISHADSLAAEFVEMDEMERSRALSKIRETVCTVCGSNKNEICWGCYESPRDD